jgi:hypothetical protein
MRLTRSLIAFVVAAVGASGAFAQSCALCYTQASAQGPHAQRSLNYGILILLVPSLVLFGGVLVMLARRASTSL